MKNTGDAQRGPDRAAALEQYRQRAGVYDLELVLFEPIRRQAIDLLALKPGDTVVDVGCGTGLSLGLLRERVGPQGQIIGIEQSPAMLELALERARRHGWDEVTFLCSPVERAHIPCQADAALFHFTHDILLRPQAIGNVMRHLRPGARVVASGLRWAPAWAVPLNLFVLAAAMRSVTSLQGLHKPWAGLERYLAGPMDVEPVWGGSIYLGSGTVADRAPGHAGAAPGASDAGRQAV